MKNITIQKKIEKIISINNYPLKFIKIYANLRCKKLQKNKFKLKNNNKTQRKIYYVSRPKISLPYKDTLYKNIGKNLKKHNILSVPQTFVV